MMQCSLYMLQEFRHSFTAVGHAWLTDAHLHGVMSVPQTAAYNSSGARKVPQGGVAIAAENLFPIIPVKLFSTEAIFAIR